MRMTGGFDERHERVYFAVLAAMACASALMLVTGARGLESTGISRDLRLVLSALSLFCCTVSYLSIESVRHSFPLVGISATAFSGALWSFGAPISFSLLLAIPALVLSCISFFCKEKADVQVESED